MIEEDVQLRLDTRHIDSLDEAYMILENSFINEICEGYKFNNRKENSYR